MKRNRNVLEPGSHVESDIVSKDLPLSDHNRHIKKSRWISPTASLDVRCDTDVPSEATGVSQQRGGAIELRVLKDRQTPLQAAGATGQERNLGWESRGNEWLTSSRCTKKHRDLELLLHEQISRLADTEPRVRVEAVQCITAAMAFLKSNTIVARDVRDAFVRHLWKEEDPFVLEKLVFSLSLISAIDDVDNPVNRGWLHSSQAIKQQSPSVQRSLIGTVALGGVSSCLENSSRKAEEIDLNKDRSSDLDVEGIDLNDNVQEFERESSKIEKSIAQELLQYLASRRQQMSDLVKLQFLRSLHHIAVNSCCLSWEVVAPNVTQELGSLNPRVRSWGIRVITEAVKRTEVYKDGHGPSDFLLGALEQYMQDPHPGVRETTVRSIISLCSNGWKLTKGSYKHLVDCLEDDFEAVRIAAVQLVGMWVKQLISSEQDGPQLKQTDEPFVQVCKRVTDMSFKVRQVACQTLSGMKFVSEAVLLQSLSKRVNRDKEAAQDTTVTTPEGSVDGIKHESTSFRFDSSAAGAFVHGLDDEYFEVRAAAVEAMAKLSSGSKKMAQSAVELLVDMLNDDSAIVRMQTMQAFLVLARAGQLLVQEKHLHMFLSVLEDADAEMRKAAHSLISSIQLPTISTYQPTIRALLAALAHYPEDSVSTLESLASLGKSHGSQTECIADELVDEMRSILNSDDGLDDPRYAAMLALLVAASKERSVVLTLLPDHMLVHADIYSHNLPQDLQVPQCSPLGSRGRQVIWPDRKEYSKISVGKDGILPSQVISSDSSSSAVALTMDGPAQESEHIAFPVLETVSRVVQTANDALLISKSGGLHNCLRIIRLCKKDLQCLLSREGDNKDAVKLAKLYLGCISYVAQCRSCLRMRSSKMTGSNSLHELGSKFETLVKRMQHCFTCQQRHLQLFIQELNLLVLVWKEASQPTIAAPDSWAILNEEINRAIAGAEKEFADEELQDSQLFRAARERMPSSAAEQGRYSSLRSAARDLVLCCWPNMIAGGTGSLATVREKHAEIRAIRSTCENPISFSPGLPLAIQLDVTLHNLGASMSNRLWVQFVLENCPPIFTYLEAEGNIINSADRDASKHCEGEMVRMCKRISAAVNVANMPSVGACVAKISIVLEYLTDLGSRIDTANRGPKEDSCLLPLSTCTEIHLCRYHGP